MPPARRRASYLAPLEVTPVGKERNNGRGGAGGEACTSAAAPEAPAEADAPAKELTARLVGRPRLPLPPAIDLRLRAAGAGEGEKRGSLAPPRSADAHLVLGGVTSAPERAGEGPPSPAAAGAKAVPAGAAVAAAATATAAKAPRVRSLARVAAAGEPFDKGTRWELMGELGRAGVAEDSEQLREAKAGSLRLTFTLQVL